MGIKVYNFITRCLLCHLKTANSSQRLPFVFESASAPCICITDPIQKFLAIVGSGKPHLCFQDWPSDLNLQAGVLNFDYNLRCAELKLWYENSSQSILDRPPPWFAS